MVVVVVFVVDVVVVVVVVVIIVVGGYTCSANPPDVESTARQSPTLAMVSTLSRTTTKIATAPDSSWFVSTFCTYLQCFVGFFCELVS